MVTLGTSNSTSISVSWEPPPVGDQNGIIQDYRVSKVKGDGPVFVTGLNKATTPGTGIA